MNDNLAPVFLDNKPVSLKDPKPKLSAILSASGRPETTDVKWLQFQPTAGKPLRSEEVLDRTTDPSKPIYLTSGKGGPSAGGPGAGGQIAGGQGASGQWAGSSKPKEGGIASNPNLAKTADPKQATKQEDDDSGMQGDTEAGGAGGRKGGETA